MFEVRLTSEARRFYERASPKLDAFSTAIFQLSKKTPARHANVRLLHGPLEGRFRYRVASLRVIYAVNQEAHRVVVEAIGSRGSIYR